MPCPLHNPPFKGIRLIVLEITWQLFITLYNSWLTWCGFYSLHRLPSFISHCFCLCLTLLTWLVDVTVLCSVRLSDCILYSAAENRRVQNVSVAHDTHLQEFELVTNKYPIYIWSNYWLSRYLDFLSSTCTKISGSE